LPREALELVHGVAAPGLAGIEVVECSPPYDSADITSLVATRIVCDTLAVLVRHDHLPIKERVL
jgi:agmatinase